MVTCTGHGLLTILIDNWVTEVVRSYNTKNGAIVIGQIL